MKFLEYIDVREFASNYSPNIQGTLEVFLSQNSSRIGGLIVKQVHQSGLVHAISVSSYESKSKDLLITRRLEREYILGKHNEIKIIGDELLIHGENESSACKFMDDLKKELA